MHVKAGAAGALASSEQCASPHEEEQGRRPSGRACQARSCMRWHAPLWPARQAALWHAGEQKRATLQPEHSCVRRAASDAPDRSPHLRAPARSRAKASVTVGSWPACCVLQGAAPRAPAAHGAQRGRAQAQVLQAGLRLGVRGDVRRGLKARDGGGHGGQLVGRARPR